MRHDLTIQEFCVLHGACLDGRDWALDNCSSMREAWEKAKPEWVVWIATRPGVLPERTLRLLAVAFARSVQHLMTDARSINALDVAERYADGLATAQELESAHNEASAAQNAAYAAERTTAQNAAYVAARNVAYNVARDAARTVARAAAYAASDAAYAASDAAFAKFATMVRQHTPNFTGGDL